MSQFLKIGNHVINIDAIAFAYEGVNYEGVKCLRVVLRLGMSIDGEYILSYKDVSLKEFQDGLISLLEGENVF